MLPGRFRNFPIVKKSTKIIGAACVVSLGVVAAIIVQSAIRIRSLPRLPAYDQVAVRQEWAKGSFAAVGHGEEFGASVAAAIQRSGSAQAGPAPHVPEATALLVHWARALNTGSFDEFWSFRVPTRKYRAHPGADSGLQRIRERVMGDDSPENRPRQNESTQQMWRELWEFADGQAKETAVEYSKGKAHAVLKPCTRCLSAIDLSSLRVDRYPATGEPPDVQKLAFQHANVGVSFAKGIVDSIPAPADLAGTGGEDRHFIVISFNVRLDTGAITPVYLSAYWCSYCGSYLPYQMATGDSSPSGLRVMF